GCQVRTQVKKIGRLPIERVRGQTLGDIDVLAVDVERRRILAIEVKALAPARTPWELGHQLSELFRATRDRKSTVQKHSERTEWLRAHKADVLSWFRVSAGAEDEWTVEPLIVLDKESASPYLTTSTVPVTTYHRLRQALGQFDIQ
ncbi:MAG: hypothetical protein ACRDJC_11800, partial [Thermomicrobiales bacterium]